MLFNVNFQTDAYGNARSTRAMIQSAIATAVGVASDFQPNAKHAEKELRRKDAVFAARLEAPNGKEIIATICIKGKFIISRTRAPKSFDPETESQIEAMIVTPGHAVMPEPYKVQQVRKMDLATVVRRSENLQQQCVDLGRLTKYYFKMDPKAKPEWFGEDEAEVVNPHPVPEVADYINALEADEESSGSEEEDASSSDVSATTKAMSHKDLIEGGEHLKMRCEEMSNIINMLRGDSPIIA